MANKKNNYEKMDMVEISPILGNINLWFHSVCQPQIKRIWGWLHRLWSFIIPKLRLRLPLRIEPYQSLRFTQICKRDGRLVPFDAQKIQLAILKAGRATGEFDEPTAQKLTIRVLSLAQAVLHKEIPTVEEIQDIVKEVLLASPFKKTAKAFILYRDTHARNREMADSQKLTIRTFL